MTTVSDVLGDYTPLSNNVVKQIKLVRGAVACKIFFTSNLDDRVCRMGLTRIATELGIDRSTASKAIGWLEKQGYVNRIKEATHTTAAHYQCTQKFYDLAAGVDLVNTPVDKVNTPVDLINQKEESKEESKENGATPELTQCDPDMLLSFGLFGQTQAEQITDRDIQAQRDIELVWIKHVADDTRRALVAFLSAMRRKYPDFAPPRDKNGQGEWGKGVNDHLANYALADLPGLYAAAIQLQIDNDLDIYRPQSLDKAIIKCRQQMGSNGQKVVASY